jgi:hypothetical protein
MQGNRILGLAPEKGYIHQWMNEIWTPTTRGVIR